MTEDTAPARATCKACGHQDWDTEFYALAGPSGCFKYCRNHISCRDRERAHRAQPKGPTMEFGEYTAPVVTEGDTYRARDHYGNSAIIKVLEHKGEIVTPNSPNGAPGVICDVYDLNLKAAFRDVLMMTGAIVDGLKPHVGKNPVVVRWGKAIAKNGRDYPTAEPASEGAITAAKGVYAAGDPFAPEVGTVQESEAPF